MTKCNYRYAVRAIKYIMIIYRSNKNSCSFKLKYDSLLVTEVCCMAVETPKRTVNRWRGTEGHLRTEVISSIFTKTAHTTWNTRLYSHPVT